MRQIIILLIFTTLFTYANCQQNIIPFSYSAAYVSDIGRNIDGGKKKENFHLGMIDLGLLFSFEDAGLWKGGEVFIQIENTHGDKPTHRLVGDKQFFPI